MAIRREMLSLRVIDFNLSEWAWIWVPQAICFVSSCGVIVYKMHRPNVVYRRYIWYGLIPLTTLTSIAGTYAWANGVIKSITITDRYWMWEVPLSLIVFFSYIALLFVPRTYRWQNPCFCGAFVAIVGGVILFVVTQPDVTFDESTVIIDRATLRSVNHPVINILSSKSPNYCLGYRVSVATKQNLFNYAYTVWHEITPLRPTEGLYISLDADWIETILFNRWQFIVTCGGMEHIIKPSLQFVIR